MDGLHFRELTINDCYHIQYIDASQYIGKAWREVNGEHKLIEINYHDNDWPNGFEDHYNSLKETIINGGSAIGAFDSHNKLIGFITINREFFGEKYKYVLLDQLFITLEQRGMGIGKRLFMMGTGVAKGWNADRIYICAGSAEETIDFYYAIGCRKAEEINKELFESDPRDLQLEYVL